MTLVDAVADPDRRARIARDAVGEAEAAVRSRPGLRGMASRMGLETINRLRPDFLARQVEHLLPAWADAVDPWWAEGLQNGDAPGWLNRHADEIARALLDVTDQHVETAEDEAAVEVYRHLREVAPDRIAAEMPRISRFVDRWAD
ncbi:MAG: hypothetical protein AAF567_03910 [Actinomycetota bacterium]